MLSESRFGSSSTFASILSAIIETNLLQLANTFGKLFLTARSLRRVRKLAHNSSFLFVSSPIREWFTQFQTTTVCFRILLALFHTLVLNSLELPTTNSDTTSSTKTCGKGLFVKSVFSLSVSCISPYHNLKRRQN